MDELNKIYVEPTNRCNLTCVTCIRHSWDEPFGDMDWPVYRALIDGLADFPGPKTIAFAGLGEPLLHEKFPEMVRLAHDRGMRTEMTSNADAPHSVARRIAGRCRSRSVHGLHRRNVGRVPRGHPAGSVSQGSDRQCPDAPPAERGSDRETPLRIGIEFVAMRRNIHALPALREIAHRIHASFILVTNILPYTADLQDEILYRHGADQLRRSGMALQPALDPSPNGLESGYAGPLSLVMRQQPNLSFLDINLSQRNNYCPFVQNRKPGCRLAWRRQPLSTASAFLHLFHHEPEEVLPPLRIRTSARTDPAGDLVEPGVYGLSRSRPKIRVFALHGLRRM